MGPQRKWTKEYLCTKIELYWNPCNPMMFAVTSTVDSEHPIKIWDVRYNYEALYEFGNGKGVTSLSWSASGLITTTDVRRWGY
ncbi:unnamed protein product [Urochloa humidicola]